VTFYNAPWALDGATISSALARRAQYAAMSGGEGIVNAADLKVSQLAVAGQGLLISSGNAVITNRYQSDPNESYTVANPGTHTILATEMPTSQPTAKSYLVLITIGDPEFSQVGHPWMTSDVLDPVEAADYVYVRPWLLEVAAGTTSFEDTGLDYPAIALARVDIPANTTTITNAMITDLRAMARPRSAEVLFDVSGGSADYISSATGVFDSPFPSNASFNVKIPKWATSANIVGWISSLYLLGGEASYGELAASLVGYGQTFSTIFDETASGTSGDQTRYSYNIGGSIAIPSAIRGTAQTFRFVGRINLAGLASLKADDRTSSFVRIRFEESPV
jgi:hypothetical protein